MIEHHALNTHNNPQMHWAGDHGELKPDNQDQRIAEAIRQYNTSAGRYIDVHAWYFTPETFSAIISSLHMAGLSRLRPLAIYPTLFNEVEFFAILELD